MKILAIYFKAGSGISVFYERIISELARTAEVDVLSDNEKPKPIEGIGNYYCLPYSKRMQGWYRRCLRWFGTTPISDRWSRKAFEMVAKDYDVVIAFTATSQLTPTVCGKYISQKLGSKFAVYAVDAIPGPGGWTRRRNEFKGKARIVARTFSAADLVASSNPHMLEYQLTVFPHKEGLQTAVLFTPSPGRYYNAPPSNEMLLLYTGSLYGMRNPDHLFKAFKRLLTVHPEAHIIMVGMKFKLRNIKKILNAEELKRVTIMGHTNNLEPLFARAKVLIDMDADLEKDPFLSSKIVTYMKVNRVILSETGKITPSREIFAGLKTVVQCDHNEDSIYNGLLHAIELADSNPDFSEREPIIDMFSIENVSATLWEKLQNL